MILRMSRIRVLGPRDAFPEVLRVIQDLGVMHLTTPPLIPALVPVTPDARQVRLRHQLRAILEDIEPALAALGQPLRRVPPPSGIPTSEQLARWARLARRVRRQAEQIANRRQALEEERALLQKYREFFSGFEELFRAGGVWAHGQAYHVILRPGQSQNVERLRALLEAAVGREFELRAHPLKGGEVALLILLPASAGAIMERMLSESGVQEIAMPAAYGGRSLAEAVPKMRARVDAIPGELRTLSRERDQLAAQHGAALAIAAAAVHDRLAQLEAYAMSAATAHAFVLEGFIPRSTKPRLETRLAAEFGPTVVVEDIAEEHWAGEEAPVVLSNPRLFRPFELLIGLVPLPHYGTIDPTPFVAVFFPMFFGLMMGDVGYGGALAGLGLLLHRRSRPGTTLRAVSEIAGACAAFGIIFGFLFGEFFGDLGQRWFGLRPLLFNRESAVVPFLGLAVALGLVHIILGLGLGVAGAFKHHRRQAIGRGISAVMILLIIATLLAAFEVLPKALFTPGVIALLVAFPILIVVEGLVAPIELLSTVGNILSYARIMALGTASVMLAVVANKMVGALGSVVVGVVFALLFHLVNFALGLFSPTIHALRLHYVEFFGRFYSPGGAQYRPFGHWTPRLDHPA